jgi:hypothetical protein
MTMTTRARGASLTGAALAVAGVLAAGCSSVSSGSSAPGTLPSAAAPARTAASPPATAATPAATPGATDMASPSPAGPAGTGGAPACTTDDLKTTTSDGAGGGTAGSFYSLIDFTNTSSASCTLYGYPGVSLRNAQGALIGAPATRLASQAPALVTLAPGATANVTLKMTDPGVYPASECGPVNSASLLVYPPNQAKSVSLAFTGQTCSSPSITMLAVGAVASGSS